ncbi:MAG: hypothetical protein AB8F26_04265 [Phycisphaerales bacterium]
MPASHHRWIDDYRSAGLVDWPVDLRKSLIASRRKAIRTILICGLPPPILFVVAFIVSIEGSSYMPALLATAIEIVLWTVTILWAAVGFSIARKARKRRRLAKRALRSPQLERFELSEHVDEQAAAAAELGAIPVIHSTALALYIAPRSSLILQVEDTILNDPEPAEIRTVAAASEVDAHGIGVRPLTTAEAEEIRQLIRRAGHRVLWVIPFFGGFSFFLVMGCVAALSRGLSTGDWITFGVLSSLWLRVTIEIVGRGGVVRRFFRFRRGLLADIAADEVEIIPGHIAIVELAAKNDPDDPPPEVIPGLVVRLPQSGRWWSCDGVPAVWRRVSSPMTAGSADLIEPEDTE